MTEIDDINKKEVQYIITNILNLRNQEPTKVKLLFTKAYSCKSIEKIKTILKYRLYFLFAFFTDDDFNYFDEITRDIYFIDKLSLYYFTIEDKKYYLLFSIVYDKSDIGLKSEKVEVFKEK